MKKLNRNILRWKIAIHEYRGNMTIIHREGNVHKNTDDLIRWALPNDESNPVLEHEEDEKMLLITGIHITDYSDSFFEIFRDSYTYLENTFILWQLLMKDW